MLHIIQTITVLTLTDHDISIISHLKLTPPKKGVSPGILTPNLSHPKPMITLNTHAFDTARPAFPYQCRPMVDDAVNFFYTVGVSGI